MLIHLFHFFCFIPQGGGLLAIFWIYQLDQKSKFSSRLATLTFTVNTVVVFLNYKANWRGCHQLQPTNNTMQAQTHKAISVKQPQNFLKPYLCHNSQCSYILTLMLKMLALLSNPYVQLLALGIHCSAVLQTVCKIQQIPLLSNSLNL